jgi:hypothetical protein
MMPEQFEGAEFLGGRLSQQSHPDRLRLFTRHLAEGEKVRVVMPLKNSVLLVTQRRLLELAPHLEAHGAWNVMGFQGFDLVNQMPTAGVSLDEEPAGEGPGTKGRLVLRLRSGHEEVAVITEVAGESTRAALARLREILAAPPYPM